MRVLGLSDPAEIEKAVRGICWKLATKGQKGLFLVRDRLEALGGYVQQEVAGQLAAFVPVAVP